MKAYRWRVPAFVLMAVAALSCCAGLKDSDCLDCHSDKTLATTNAAGSVESLFADEALLRASVHRTNTCSSCHSDLTEKHPDDNIAAQPVNCAKCHVEQFMNYGASVHAQAQKRILAGGLRAPKCQDCHDSHGILPPTSPLSPLHFTKVAQTCGKCHQQEASDVLASVHGKAVAKGERDAATCTDCHAEHKIIALSGSSSLRISQETCSKCHASARLNTKYNLPGDRVKTFFESYHGLAAKNGSTEAANCASCHGAHKILPSADPRSTVYKDNLVATCGQCHPGANANFVQEKVHVDIAAAKAGVALGGKINWWVRRTYLFLIIVVISLMAAHNFLIFRQKLAARARLHERSLIRMDLSQRRQHLVLVLSFLILAWTGFALKFPDSIIAQSLGSNEFLRRWLHRIAGVILLGAGAFHLFYVALTIEGRRLLRDFVPGVGDMREVLLNILFLLGIRPVKPRTGRFGYAEKMEYWAVVWGTIIMGVTGLIIWLKVSVTRFAPGWVVEVATTIHYYEAILACLAIVVWHFYHVIFDPDVYPLNRAVLDGRVSEEWLAGEHPLDPALGKKP